MSKYAEKSKIEKKKKKCTLNCTRINKSNNFVKRKNY